MKKLEHRVLETNLPFNVDMMFGLPFQTPETVVNDISILTKLKVPTITIYRLRNADRHGMGIGNKAVWNNQRIRENLRQQNVFPSLEETYQMRDGIVKKLIRNNYHPSPCGWWSLPDTYPNGNIPKVSKNKWQNHETMVAYGPGAYGWLSGNSQNIIQTHNITDIAAYAKHMNQEQTPPLAYGRILENEQAVATVLGFAFKANQPINIDKINRRFNVQILRQYPYSEVIDDLLSKEFIEISQNRKFLRPTLKGEALHEEIISTYIHGKIGDFSNAVCNKI